MKFPEAREVYSSLGKGSDTFVGGRGADAVAGNDYNVTGYQGVYGIDAEADVIHTGAGRDDVVSGGKGGVNDDIDLGAGDDELELRGDRMVDGGVLAGGSGSDQLIPSVYDEDAGLKDHLVIDNRAGTITVDDVETLQWSGFERFLGDGLFAKESTVYGSRRDETYSGDARTVHAYMRGGNDTVYLSAYEGTPASDVHGGRGRDRVSMRVGVKKRGAVVLDLAKGTVVGADTTLIDLHGVDIYTLGSSNDVTALGTDEADSIDVIGCRVTVRGRDGDDVLKASHDGDYGCVTHARVYGGGGDDKLSGSKYNDLLVGSRGRDVADGSRGTDTCRAEVTRDCEKR